jgi:hypothetical protein
MVCNHDILVARACLYREASHVISIEFADWVDMEVTSCDDSASGMGDSIVGGGLGRGVDCGLVDWSFCRVCARCQIVSSEAGQK